MGYFSRKYGLTVDHLRRNRCAGRWFSRDGQRRRTSNLFWGLRGGGGNFGIVVGIRFEAQPTDTVLAGACFWDISKAEAVMQWYRKFIVDAPEDLYGFSLSLPCHLATFPEHLHGQVVSRHCLELFRPQRYGLMKSWHRSAILDRHHGRHPGNASNGAEWYVRCALSARVAMVLAR